MGLSERRTFQAEGTASAKTLRYKCACASKQQHRSQCGQNRARTGRVGEERERDRGDGNHSGV